jgi:hypothetical protein
MKKRTNFQILDSLAGDHLAGSIDLAPRILSGIQKWKPAPVGTKRKFLTPAVFPLLVLGIILLITVPVAAAVLQRLFVYIPGIGLVREGQIRVLAEPVSVTRGGITVTVAQAVADSTQTALVYSVDGLPADIGFHYGEPAACLQSPIFRLPDGSSLAVTGGLSSGLAFSRWEYAGLPPDVYDATLVLPCIGHVDSIGVLPGDWEIPLRFIPAPPDMTVFPVLELPAPEEPAFTTPTAGAHDPSGISITLDRIACLGEKYVLYASVDWVESGLWIDSIPSGSIHLLDAGGREIPIYQTVDDAFERRSLHIRASFTIAPTAASTLSTPWVLVVDDVSAYQSSGATFMFDGGIDPRPGQIWTLNQTVDAAGHRLTINSAQWNDGNKTLLFEITPDSEVISATVNPVGLDWDGYISQALPPDGLKPGNPFQTGPIFLQGMPRGKITFTVANILIPVHGPWQITWTPPIDPGCGTPTP